MSYVRTTRRQYRKVTHPATFYTGVASNGDPRVYAYLKSGRVYFVHPTTGAWYALGELDEIAPQEMPA